MNSVLLSMSSSRLLFKALKLSIPILQSLPLPFLRLSHSLSSWQISSVKNIPFKVDVLDDETAASLRKFYLTYYDIRAVIMDLVSKLDEMRHLDHLPKYRQQILSLQVLKIYSPLAHAVGIWQKGRSFILLRLALLFIHSVSAPTDTGYVQQQRIALGFGILRVSVLLRI